MEFSRQEYWSGLPFPSPGDLLIQGSNPVLLHCRQRLYLWATNQQTNAAHSLVLATACQPGSVRRSVLSNSAIPWTVARQVPRSRQEYWSGVAMPFSRESSWPRDRTQVSQIAGRFFPYHMSQHRRPRGYPGPGPGPSLVNLRGKG